MKLSAIRRSRSAPKVETPEKKKLGRKPLTDDSGEQLHLRRVCVSITEEHVAKLEAYGLIQGTGKGLSSALRHLLDHLGDL